ncbi:MAG: PAS domain-containing protein [Rhodospirillales bacterium]|jgi:PAS domain S-box-containing protein|nr:PAS domain-containing protein [Rhodospirillales bacterium]
MASGPGDSALTAPAPPSAGAPARGQPLVRHLSLFAAALVIPAIALIVLLFWRAAEAERTRIDQDVRDVAKTVTVALDRDFAVMQSLLFALATAPRLHAGDHAAFHQQASELAGAEGLDLVLRDLSGQLLLDTRLPWGQPLPRSTLDIDWQVIESRRAAVSNLFIDATSQQPSFAVVVPVVRDGHVVAMLSAVAPSERLVPVLRDRLPAELWAASVSDRNGIIVARTRGHAAWVGRPITAELRRAAVHASGTWDGPSHEGAALRGGYARSPESGWLTAVGVERGRLMAPLYRMLWLAGAAAAALGGLSALLAVMFGRRINRSIRALADAAVALGRTGAVPRFHSGVAEVDSVGTALADAAARLGERDRALRDSEQRLQIALDAASLGSWDLDLRSGAVIRSMRHDQMFGYRELQPDWGVAIAERHVVEADRPLFRAELARARETGALSFEVRVRWPDGSIHWIAPVGRTSYDADGRPVRMAGVVADITERKQAEEALRQSEALARARADEIQVLYDAVPIGIVLFDRDFRFLRINERLAAINGRSNADHVGRLIEEMLPAETAAALRAMQPRLLAGEEIADVEITGPDNLTGKDGAFLVSYRPLRDQQGEVRQFLGTVLDVTARRRAEAALRERTRQAVEAERLLDALMTYVPAGVTIAAAPDVRIVRVSDYGSRLLGRPRAQLEGIAAEAHVDAYKVFHAETGAPALPEALPLTRAVQAGEIVVNEEWLVADAAGRRIPVLCNAGPIKDEDGTVVAGVITWHDITELKSAQEHQRLLLLELNHRVKNMLATVQAVADQTFQAGTSEDARQAFSARIVSLARTHDLLARRSWQQAGLHDVVLQALAPFQGAPDPRFDVEAGIDVLLKPKAALALSMALHELATNAVKYGALSNGRGRVGVAWEVARGSGERLRFSWRETGGPPVFKPSRRGFGSVMIERGLARELNAEVALDYAPDGLVFQMEMPLPYAGDG